MQNIIIKDFNLDNFSKLLNQSLNVTTQLMIEFNDNMIKSCSFSNSKSFIKLWTIPVDKLIVKPEQIDNALFDDLNEPKLNIPNFNFYILKGDAFKKYISVHSSGKVDLEFTLADPDSEGKIQATSLTITGETEDNTPLKTSFILTSDELITNKISDFSEILKACTPDKTMFSFVLNDKQISEVGRLIKNLHRASPDNSSFLTINIENGTITIKDKIFEISYPLVTTSETPVENITFNMLKADIGLSGAHTFTIFTQTESAKIILYCVYGGSLIWCMTTKVNDMMGIATAETEELSIDSLDLSIYELEGAGTDDLPF